MLLKKSAIDTIVYPLLAANIFVVGHNLTVAAEPPDEWWRPVEIGSLQNHPAPIAAAMFTVVASRYT
jgi:hypothetical protein